MNVISNPETKMSTLVHEVNNNLRLKYTQLNKGSNKIKKVMTLIFDFKF